jgi:PAS domain-containing protein
VSHFIAAFYETSTPSNIRFSTRGPFLYVQEFITNDFQASVQAVLDQALQGEETDNFEFPLITKAGAHIEVLLNATTRRDEQGNVIGVVGIGQDITARLAQEREYSKLIDTANAPIFGVNTFLQVNVWNQCAMRLVGYSSEEVMGKNLVKEFITDEFKTAVQAVLDQALHGEETANFEFPLSKSNPPEDGLGTIVCPIDFNS